MRRRGITLLTGLCVAGVLVVGCSDDDAGSSGSPSGSSSTSTTAETSSTTRGTTTSVDEAGDPSLELADGTHFGYITTLVAGHNEIVGEFDLAQLLTGDAAQQAANEDGAGEVYDYYIRNVNPRLRPITVDPEAEVFDVDYANVDLCCEARPTTIAEFVAKRDAENENRTAVHLTVEDGVVVRIEEQFFA